MEKPTYPINFIEYQELANESGKEFAVMEKVYPFLHDIANNPLFKLLAVLDRDSKGMHCHKPASQLNLERIKLSYDTWRHFVYLHTGAVSIGSVPLLNLNERLLNGDIWFKESAPSNSWVTWFANLKYDVNTRKYVMTLYYSDGKTYELELYAPEVLHVVRKMHLELTTEQAFEAYEWNLSEGAGIRFRQQHERMYWYDLKGPNQDAVRCYVEDCFDSSELEEPKVKAFVKWATPYIKQLREQRGHTLTLEKSIWKELFAYQPA